MLFVNIFVRRLSANQFPLHVLAFHLISVDYALNDVY